MILRKFARGQSAVELALAAPILVVLLLVVADFARVFYLAMGIASAARAGVQYGAQSYVKAVDNAGMTTAATNDAQSIGNITVVPTHFCMCDGAQCSPAQASACVVSCGAPPSTCTEPKVFVEVKTSATFNTLIKYPGLPSNIPLSSVAVLQAQKGTS
ncbi:MAG TPA: TadE family protein [Candidatus Binataceae bacterium]|nr:TadE family protein [Candidatus Binataceae bacterium]